MNLSKNHRLSICCLGYNHASFLKDTLDSICAIQYENIEVIVVDDGSKDNSVPLLNELAVSFPYPLKIIAQQNTGNIGKNFNNALKEATGEYVTFIALDDVFHSKIILSELSEMNNNPQLAFIASSKALSIDNEGIVNENTPPELSLYRMENPTLENLLELEYSEFGSFYIQGSIIKKEIVDIIGGFDEDMTGDDIVLRTKIFNFMLKNSQWDFKIIKENNVFYRLHDHNIHKNTPRQIKIVTEYLDKFWPNKPNPSILINWACHMINTSSFEKSIETLTLNKRAKSLLNDDRIKHAIKNSLKNDNEKPFFKKFIFSKQKINDAQRQIILFGFIKFIYKKHKKISQKPKVHYLKY
ncbi:glycosyltransferase family A protein [Acinetobacter bouvetii]|uniref:Putative glycosyltransferase EpsJ n=1 Tax=Acinetobacter bouvetii TaxID=202951 RepID=A0A811GB89_9GAMM|nr:glycosyltransferase family 2 protein [Acinetobacter bouvetii]CAB1217415.1 putative glycosyltransferase EpsJ [Acinetobacter bouvetii]